ncbi:MAG TPA: acetyl-CoA decarbonylase/synthase complex subunit gamma [Methanoregulaceae archaeon]|nr:acetyl-CoA decarbonylase/synthase complex subunit gamma [Methanoregulaceae archaeon]
MALKALDIYKLLPKKNCKECGDPTCLTFAMKLASGKGELEKCPYLDENAQKILGASTKPPIQRVRIGVGERSFIVGDEFVQFRHDKTFYHQPGIMVLISDLWPADTIKEVVAEVRDSVLVRIGTDLRINGVAIKDDSGSAEKFAGAVETVESTADLPEVLIAQSPEIIEAGLAHCGNYRPLIHAATNENYREMSALAKKFGCPLIIKADNFEDMVALSGHVSDEGAPGMLIDVSSSSLHRFINTSTAIRQNAIARKVPELGYPIYYDSTVTGMQDAAMALGVLKFASVLVADRMSRPSQYALLTLRQNIYTDPQKPIQMTPGLYRVGEPGRNSPVLLTVNFSLTYFTLQGYLEATRRACYMFIVDTEGLSVLTSVAAGKLNETLVAESIRKFGLESEVEHKTLIIPGYAAPLSGKIEEETGWKVLVGPRDAAEIGEFLEKEWEE